MKIEEERASSRNKEGLIRWVLQTWTTITEQCATDLVSDVPGRLVNC